MNSVSAVISLPDSSELYTMDENLTKSIKVNQLKNRLAKARNTNFTNVTKDVIDQKTSNLCVPISVKGFNH